MNTDQLEAQRNIAKLESALQAANEKRKMRDYFAAEVIGGMMAHGESYSIKAMAEYAYQMADAMIEERAK